MKPGFFSKTFVFFLCLSFFILTSGFSTILAEVKIKNLPIGEMVSRGEVKFTVKDKAWKNVDPSYFPVFQGLKIKTEKGGAIISLVNDHRVEMGQGSLISFEQKDEVRLIQGRIDFRISSGENMNFRVGNLTVTKNPSWQAAQKLSRISQNNEAAVGAIFVHAHGSVTVQSTQGQLVVLNQEQIVLAAVAPKQSLTIPSIIAEKHPAPKTPPRMMAQVGEIEPAPEEKTYLGLSGKAWGYIGLGTLAFSGLLIAAGGAGAAGAAPVCP